MKDQGIQECDYVETNRGRKRLGQACQERWSHRVSIIHYHMRSTVFNDLVIRTNRISGTRMDTQAGCAGRSSHLRGTRHQMCPTAECNDSQFNNPCRIWPPGLSKYSQRQGAQGVQPVPVNLGHQGCLTEGCRGIQFIKPRTILGIRDNRNISLDGRTGCSFLYEPAMDFTDCSSSFHGKAQRSPNISPRNSVTRGDRRNDANGVQFINLKEFFIGGVKVSQGRAHRASNPSPRNSGIGDVRWKMSNDMMHRTSYQFPRISDTRGVSGGQDTRASSSISQGFGY